MMKKNLEMFLLLSIGFWSTSAMSRETNNQSIEDRLSKLEERVRVVEGKLSKDQRKATCPETCKCGPQCACVGCDCGVAK